MSFIYTGNAPKLDILAVGLLAAAEKYQIEQLKVMSEESLCKSLKYKPSAKYWVSLLAMGHLYQAEKLKKTSLDIIVEKRDLHCFEDTVWEECFQSYPDLLAEVIEACEQSI